MALRLYSGTVLAEWVDELDHMNFLEYQRLADRATGDFCVLLGGGSIGAATSAPGVDVVIVATHVRYLRELRLGAELVLDTSLVAWDDKRFHLLHALRSQRQLCCVVEVLLLGFDPVRRRAAAWSPAAAQRLSSYARSAAPEAGASVMAWLNRGSGAG